MPYDYVALKESSKESISLGLSCGQSNLSDLNPLSQCTLFQSILKNSGGKEGTLFKNNRQCVIPPPRVNRNGGPWKFFDYTATVIWYFWLISFFAWVLPLKQNIGIDRIVSVSLCLLWAISVLGPILFTLYSATLWPSKKNNNNNNNKKHTVTMHLQLQGKHITDQIKYSPAHTLRLLITTGLKWIDLFKRQNWCSDCFCNKMSCHVFSTVCHFHWKNWYAVYTFC